MKIRYRKKGTNVWNTTPEFNPEGTPLNHYRLGIIVDGEVKVGDDLMEELLKPNFPDIPFAEGMPVVLLPSGHYEWVEELVEQENGTYVLQKVYTWVQDITEDEYQSMLSDLAIYLRQYLVTAQEVYLPYIPDGEDYEWQLVDMSKPYRQRFTPIPVEKGKYRGNVWQVSSEDIVPQYLYWAGRGDILNIICQRHTKL